MTTDPLTPEERAQEIVNRFVPWRNMLTVSLVKAITKAITEAIAAETKRCWGEAREAVAQWMLLRSIPTGHGDTLEALLAEIANFIEELRSELAAEKARADQLEEQVGVEHEMVLILKAELAREALGTTRPQMTQQDKTICELAELISWLWRELQAARAAKSEERDDAS